MRSGRAIAIGIVALALTWNAFAGAPAMSIKFAEVVRLPATAGKIELDAYGRRFPLTLENNDRLLKAIPAARKAGLQRPQILRGKVDGVPGSWVRLARV